MAATGKPTPVPIERVVAARLIAVRQTWGLTQEDIAAAAKRLGLTWGRSTLARLEAGNKVPRGDELLALPSVVADAILHSTPAATGVDVALAELLAPGPNCALQVAPGLTLSAAEVKRGLPLTARARRRVEPTIGEAERHAARALGVTPEQLTAAAFRLWGHGLADERDQRVAKALRGETVTPSSRQAHRGNVTRVLIEELRPHVRKP